MKTKSLLKILLTFIALAMPWTAKAFYFQDPDVKAICVANWDTDGDGELSFAEAAAVTSLGTVFRGNTSIDSFLELQYFTSLTSLTCPDGYGTFQGCYNLDLVNLPDALTTIGKYAFYDCRALRRIEIPSAVTLIDESAFESCWSLYTVDYRDGYNYSSLNTINEGAFQGCSVLTSFSIPYGVTEIRENTFRNSGLRQIEIPPQVTSIGNYAFFNCVFLRTLTWHNNVASIGESAFEGSGLTGTLSIPNSVTTIGNHVFSGCSSLTQLIIPSSVTSIEASAFRNCSGLTSVTIGNNVQSIGDYVFYNCNSLPSVTIPPSVATLGNHAFNNCSNLTSVTIQSNALASANYGTTITLGSKFGNQVTGYTIGPQVTAIGNYAFYGCSGMTSVAIGNNVQSIGNNAFQGCSGMTSVAIGNSVTSIGNYAFHGCSSLNSVTIGNSVTSIGNYAFGGCAGLNSVNIGNSVTSIGNYAFWGCTGLTSTYYMGTIAEWCNISFSHEYSNPLYHSHNLYIDNALVTTADLVLPGTVTIIKPYSFYGCTGLNSVTIPVGVTSIGNSAFGGCTALTSVTLRSNAVVSATYTSFNNFSTIFGNQVESYTLSGLPSYPIQAIGNYAFDMCTGMTSVTIGNNVQSIGNNAFYGCSGLTSIEIPNSLTSIGNYAFYGCSGLTSVTLHSPTSIGNNAFEGCSGLTSVILNYVTSIGNYAFYGCSDMTSLTIGSYVQSIGYKAFSGCSSLQSITCQPSTPPQLGANAFQDVDVTIPVYVQCGSLLNYQNYNNTGSPWGGFTNLFDPCAVIQFEDENVKEICVSYGNWDFNNDDELSYIEASLVTSLGIAFQDNTDIVSFDELQYFTGLESLNTAAGHGTFKGCLQLTSIVLPNSLTSIGDEAFYECSSLTSIEIPNSVTSIGNVAFYECESLTSIEIPNSVTSIGYEAFFHCYSLTSIEIPNSVTSIGDGVFQYCSGLTSVTIPDNVTSIGQNAFRNCSGLTSIEIPNSVTSIGNYAFFECSGLTSIEIPNSVVSIGNGVFGYCYELTGIVVAAGNATYDSRGNCNAIIETNTNTLVAGCKSTVIPGTVTSIGNNAFDGCSGLTSIAIPNTVTSIGNYAFSDCSGLTSIEIPNSVTSMGDHAFSDCSGLTSIEIPNSVTSIGNYAFFECSGLQSITCLAATPPTLGNSAFSSTTFSNAPLTVPCGSLSNYQNASGWSSFTNYIEACDNIQFSDANVKAICVANWDTNGDGELSYDEAAAVTTLNPSGESNNSVFKNNTAITSFNELQYFTGLTSIDTYTFYYCTNLSSITIPSGVTSINTYAFMYCTRLTSIMIPSNVTSIASNAFYNCIGLTSVTLSNGLQSINQFAFNNCSSLIAVVIPSSVNSIGGNPFNACSSLESIIVEAGNTVYDSRDNCNAIIKTSNNLLVSGCKNSVIPNSVTNIYSYAFNGCTGLASVTLPSNVSAINSYAFNNCTSLVSITIEATTPPTLGTNVFQNVSTSIPVNVPCGTKAAYQAATGWSAFTNYMDPCEVIVFADANVKAICVQHWDTNNDGELNYAEAAAVTTLNPSGITNSSLFKGNSGITSFDELQYFTGLTSIEPYAFSGCNLMASVIIPSGVTCINSYAFNLCRSLTFVTIPSGVTSINSYAFQGCSGLTSITIPSNVTTIGTNPFMSCIALESITVEAGNPNYDSRDNCNAIIAKSPYIKVVSGCKNTVIPSGVSIIGSYAFHGCSGLTTISIPSGVTNINLGAFSHCENLTSVIIPSTVTSIGERAFNSCTNLTSINIPSSVTSINTYAFYNCTGLTSITVEATTPPSLSSNVFNNVPQNIPVYVPCNTKTAYQNALGWSDFTNFIDPCAPIVFADQNVKAICLANWDGILGDDPDGELTYAEAAAVTDIGDVFSEKHEITSFNELQYFTGLTAIEYEAFYYCTNLTSVIIPSGVTTIVSEAFYECTSLTSVTIPNGVTDIGFEAFCACTSLVSVILPNTLTFIDEYAFEDCTSLTSITIPSSVDFIEGNPFIGCPALTSIIVEAGNTVYDSRNDCNAIIETATNKLISGCKNTVIPSMVPSISYAAFEECTSLVSITIPSSVTSIGQYAFYGCTGLTFITVEATTPPTLGTNAFHNVPIGIPVYVPCGTKAVYQVATGWNNFTNYVDPCEVIVFADPAVKAICVASTTGWDTNGDGELSYLEAAAVTALNPTGGYNTSPFYYNRNITSFNELQYFTGLTSIDANAFSLCSNLASVIIPSNVTSLDSKAFYYCSGLTSVTLPSSLISIGDYAFQYCSSLTSITLPSSLTSIGYNAFNGCTSLTAISIPSSVTSISSAGNPFSGCSALANITVEAGNTVYDSRDNCNAIITTSTNRLITGCMNTVIPGTVTVLDNYAFYGITTLTSITLPSSVTSIANYVFEGCTCLTSVNISSGVISISNRAFYGCTGLASITVEAITPPTLGSNVFKNVPTGILVYVPCGSVAAYQTYNSGDPWGSFTNFIGEGCSQESALVNGWNWWVPTVAMTVEQLETGLGSAGLLINSQEGGFARYVVGEGWSGTLSEIEVGKMYKIETSAACTLSLQGDRPGTVTVTIVQGYNWFGYTGDQTTSIAAALGTFEPASGDKIISENGTATFNGSTWTGNFTELVPGHGYIYYSNSSTSKTLVFSASAN